MDFGEYINPDDIAARLQGSYDWRVIRERRSFSFETVMSHESKIDFMRRAHNAGFHVTLYFIGTENPVININRVANRVALGGHDVPHELIVSRYHRTMNLLWAAATNCDRTVIFDSSKMNLGIAPLLEFKMMLQVSEQQMGHSHVVNSEVIERAFQTPQFPQWICRFLLEKARAETARATFEGIPACFSIRTAPGRG